MLKTLHIVLVVTAFAACAARKPLDPFHVVAGNPYYLLRTPDKVEVPFPETLKSFSDMRAGWADMRPGMELRLEQAYFKDLAAKRVLDNFAGLESVQYRADSNGRLLPISVKKLPKRPAEQASVSSVLSKTHARKRFHRFFFQVVVDKKSGAAKAILLSSETMKQLEDLGRQVIADASLVCGRDARHCTVIPDGCSASLALNVIVNGKPIAVLWGNTVQSVVSNAKSFSLSRGHRGRDTPVLFDPKDPATLKLPLLPNDVLNFTN